MKGIDYVNSMRKMLQSRIVVHAQAYLVHPVGTCGLTNQQTKKLVSSIAISLARLAKARSEIQSFHDDDSSSTFSCIQLFS